MFRIIGTILRSPHKTFSIRHSPYLVAAASSILISLSVTLFFFNTYIRSILPAYAVAGVFIGLIVTSFIGFMLTGCLIKLACNILGGKGGFREGLKVISFSSIVPSAGFFIASAISVAAPAAGMPAVLAGSGVSMIILPVSMVIGFALSYKGMIDVFRLDAVRSLIAFSSVASAVMLSFYVIVYLNVSSLITSFSMLGV